MATNSSELWEHLGLTTDVLLWPRWRLVRAAAYLNLLILYCVLLGLFRYCVSPVMVAVVPQLEGQWRAKLELGFWTVSNYVLERQGWEVEIVGDPLDLENALVLSNHAGLVDHMIMGYLVQCVKYPPETGNHQVKAKSLTGAFVPQLKFFTWFTLWTVPQVDYFKNIFQSDENWELDGETLGGLFSSAVESAQTQWVVLFPEVNIFTARVAKMQRMMGEKHFLPLMTNVLYPRFGGVVNAVGAMYESKFTRLYDITLVYYKMVDGEWVFGCPTLVDAISGQDKYKVLVHVKGKFLSRVPLKRNKLEKWVEGRWLKKDKLITKLQKKVVRGKFDRPLTEGSS